MAKRILVPVDPRDDSIVPILAALARGSGATVRLLRVMSVPEMKVARYGRVIAYADQEMARLQGEAMDDLDVIKAQLDGIPVEAVVRFGAPVAEIALEAEVFGADVIVLTSSHRGPLARLFRSDVSNRVVRKSRVPVLVLRSGRAPASAGWRRLSTAPLFT